MNRCDHVFGWPRLARGQTAQGPAVTTGEHVWRTATDYGTLSGVGAVQNVEVVGLGYGAGVVGRAAVFFAGSGEALEIGRINAGQLAEARNADALTKIGQA